MEVLERNLPRRENEIFTEYAYFIHLTTDTGSFYFAGLCVHAVYGKKEHKRGRCGYGILSSADGKRCGYYFI